MKKKTQYFADMLYRCGANYKTYFSCPIPNKMKEGDETTIEELGFRLSDFFHSVVTSEYNPEYDHNILEVIEVFKSKEACESDFYEPEDINGANEPKKNKYLWDIHKFADVDEAILPKDFKKKITNTETYIDQILDEELYGVERVREQMQENGIVFNHEQETFFDELEKELTKADCAYFRIIKP